MQPAVPMLACKKYNSDFPIPVPKAVSIAVGNYETITDTLSPVLLKPYTVILNMKRKNCLHAATGTKSVLFNTNGSKLYAMNLEGMSVYEFDQASQKNCQRIQIQTDKRNRMGL